MKKNDEKHVKYYPVNEMTPEEMMEDYFAEEEEEGINEVLDDGGIIVGIVDKMVELAENGTDYNGKCYISNSACYDDAKAVADLLSDILIGKQASDANGKLDPDCRPEVITEALQQFQKHQWKVCLETSQLKICLKFQVKKIFMFSTMFQQVI